MKKYLLLLSVTLLSFASTWAQGNDNKPELPVEGAVLYDVLKVGQEYPCPLQVTTLPADAYEASYSVVPVAGYTDVITVDESTGLLIANKVGKAKATARFESKTPDYRTWERTFDFTINPAEYRISLAASDNGNGTFASTPSVEIIPATDTNAPMLDASKYTIRYTLEGEIPGSASVDPTTGVVTVSNDQASQTFYVLATLSPKDRGNYVGATAKAPITIQGSIKGAYLMKQADGSWVAYLSSPEETGNDIIAKFTVVDTDGTATQAGSQAQIDLLAEFKQAKDIKVMGNINSFNIEQLVHAIGTDANAFTALTEAEGKSLDFGGATMVGPFTTATKSVNGQTVITYSGVPTAVNKSYDPNDIPRDLTNVTRLVLPKPDTSNPAYTVLPAGLNKLFTGQNDQDRCNLVSLTIPEGWTEIAAGFSSVYQQWDNRAFKKLTELKLANSIEKIGAYAFAGLNVKVLTMPYFIRRIDQGAFSPSPSLQDVYFTGPAPEFVHTLAFSGETQMGNNTAHLEGYFNQINPEVTRFDYYDKPINERVLVCLLHFPKQYQSQYMDETRVYKMLPEDQPYMPGDPSCLYTPEGWTPYFIQQVQSKKIDWNAYVSSQVDPGLKDQFYGYDMIWPSQNQMSTGFAIAQAGYQWNGQPLRTADQYQPGAEYSDTNNSIDRRGLYQFIIGMCNADFDFEFELDQWYTIALPFNMSVDEIKKVFGNDTQVCRFSKVIRQSTGSEKVLRFEFRKSVMGDRTGEYDGTDYTDYVSPHKEDGEIHEYTGTGKEGILHHFPYMIKPGGTTPNEYVTHDGSKWHFNSWGFDRITGTLHPETRSADGIDYLFSPILSETHIKVNSYILVERTDKPVVNNRYRHEYVFYRGKNVDGTYVPGGTAHQNTAYIQLSAADGQSDLATFFEGVTPIQRAMAVKSFFGDEDEETTEIEKVEIVCGNDEVRDNKVYTINGVLMNGDNLPAGLYIKNGKKILVK